MVSMAGVQRVLWQRIANLGLVGLSFFEPLAPPMLERVQLLTHHSAILFIFVDARY
jgi:hypothetical protein